MTPIQFKLHSQSNIVQGDFKMIEIGYITSKPNFRTFEIKDMTSKCNLDPMNILTYDKSIFKLVQHVKIN